MFKDMDVNVLIQSSRLSGQNKYWMKKLSADMEKTRILPGNPGDSGTRKDSGKLDIFLADALCEKILKLSKESDLSIFIILLAAMKILIYRYTDNGDITVAAPINRKKISPETINSCLFIRDQVKGDMSFKELLLQVRQSVLDAHENQDYPFDKIIENLFDNPREQSNVNISNIFCSLNNIHAVVKITKLEMKLSFIFEKENGKIRGYILFDGHTYEDDFIKKLSGHFSGILRNSLEDINRKISQIPFLSAEEVEQLIYSFNNNKAGFSRDRTIYRLVEKNAAHIPDHIALGWQDHQLTYRELNKQANQLARVLRESGIQRDRLVAILLDRSLEMAVGILATWKAGGAYIPLDTQYPIKRLIGILHDSSAPVLLTRREYIHPGFHDPYQGEIVITDRDYCRMSQKSTDNLNLEMDMNSLAYVIYTSGSTGKPKGVIIEHIGMMNHIQAKINELQITGRSIIAQNASHTFDISVWQFFTALTGGGRTVIYSNRVILEPQQFISKIIADRVTVLEIVPSYLSVMLDSLDLDFRPLRFLHYLLVTGETLKPKLVERWLEKYPHIKMVNAYGPTEASDDITHYVMDKPPAADTIPIGKPVQNFNIYILNEAMDLCPIGIKGEICVSGVGVGRGYLNDIEKTDNAFMEDCYAEKNGRRLYKTGDLGRWLPGGNIEFFGRKDHQVKIRGFRIELGEIENKLAAHPDVKEAVVLAKEDKQGNKCLCAYVLGNRKIDLPEIKKYLLENLSDYMVPAYFVQMDSLPLTPNGKVNRKVLPDIESEPGDQYIAPGNVIEEKLGEIWEAVLGKTRVSMHDNFFEHGGDSIKAIQIIARTKKAGYKVEMRDIFQNPTIARLAPLVKQVESIAGQDVVTGILPLTPIQEEFFASAGIDPHHYNQAVVLYSEEMLEEDVVRAIFSKIQEHHDALRITYKKVDGKMVQTNHGVKYPLYMQIVDLCGHEKPLAALETTANRVQASIDLEKGPLMKLVLFHLNDGDRLLIVIHHLVTDGVSWRILFEDIEILYQQYKRKKQLKLAPKTDSFKSWAERLLEYANSPGFLKEKEYWSKLASTGLTGITKDFAQGDNNIKDEEKLSFRLNVEDTKLLLIKVNDAFSTRIDEILMTALGLGVKRTFQIEKLHVAVENHGREEIFDNLDVNRTIGWFTALYVVLLDMTHEGDLARLIKEVKENLRRIPNNGIGYGILKYLTAKENKQEIDFRQQPVIGFNYLGQFDADIKQMSFNIAKESAGKTLSPDRKREFELEATGIIVDKKLEISLSYSKNQYKKQTIERLINNFETELKRIIFYCSGQQKRQLTPVDLTYKGLSIDALEQMEKQYPIEDIYVLSPMQEGMLFFNLLDRDSLTYFEQVSYRIHGQLDILRVEKSLKELLKRHDVLRTVFLYEGLERPLQVVLKDKQADFCFKDIREIGETDTRRKDDVIKKIKEDDRNHPFNLSKDTLMRVLVVKLGDTEYEFIWSFYHIVMDGWCLGILASEFFEIYNSYHENRPYELAPVRPYRAYIQWLEKLDMGESKRYWANYLAGYDQMAAVPANAQTGANDRKYKNRRVKLRLDTTDTLRMTQLCSRNNVTLNTMIQTVWAIILGRYCDRRDIVFGAVVSGRPSGIDGIETMVGLFINTIPVRIQYGKQTTFIELLVQTQEKAIESEVHHYYPLTKIQSVHPLKQELLDHVMVFENYPIANQLDGVANRKKQGLEIEISNVDVFEQINYDFGILVTPAAQLNIHLNYNANVYDGEFVKRTVGHIKRIIEQVLDNDTLSIEALEILSEQERKKILYDLNDTAVKYRDHMTIHGLFQEQAEKTPDNIALVINPYTAVKDAVSRLVPASEAGKPVQLTYRELNRQSAQMAGLLKEKGVMPGAIVGLMVEPSVKMAVALLAILKAGGAYLPLDPAYPGDRINYMLADSSTSFLLTTKEIAGKINFDNEIVYLNGNTLEGISSSACSRNRTPLSARCAPAAVLAYIIYTSGSTGRPKGVAVEHGTVINTLECRKKNYQINNHNTTIQLFSYAFDGFVTSFFTPIISGAKVILPSDADMKDTRKIINAMVTHKVSHFISVPALYRAILGLMSQKEAEGLKVVTLAGDKITTDILKMSTGKNKNLEVAVEYGVTEVSVMSTIHRHQEREDTVKIGKPVWNTKIYILNRENKIQPLGVPGELFIAGRGVTRGYLNRPELTAKKFVRAVIRHSSFVIRKLKKAVNSHLSLVISSSSKTNDHSSKFFTNDQWPMTNDSSSKLYRTGDLARWLSDGNIEFLGRIDHQVKIRGYRIELGEIETQLMKHEGIKEVVVLCQKRKSHPGDEHRQQDEYLCAYVIPAETGTEPNASDLQGYLSKKLPPYLIPSYFVKVDKIPLTPIGKVDRNALASYGSQLASGVKYAAPQNETEKQLTAIWMNALAVEKIGIDDNFFNIGGNSILTINVVDKIKKAFNKDISVPDMFRFLTIRALAGYLDQNEEVKDNPREHRAEKIDEGKNRMKQSLKMMRRN